jgi:SAM-dependent methyltransferase
MSSSEPHSAYWLRQEFRNQWWDRDQLALALSRIDVQPASSVLDVGCGVGHWTFLLGSVLPSDSTLQGLDRELEWVHAARRRAAELGLADRARFDPGDAGSLPFEDASFDLVTCQTLLMHLPDPQAAIQEMVRVTKPGGVVLASEPNNLIVPLVLTSVSASRSVDQLLDTVRFAATCERGKQALGEGNSSIGNLVPGYFAEAGLTSIHVIASERTPALYPPYAGEEQRALRDYVLDVDLWIGERAEARRHFIAGGGTEPEFDRSWERRLKEQREDAAAIAAQTFHTAGGFLLYLTAGHRPS